ncbi:unnamed protein product [Rotaria sordida]|uniref:CTLH domain-containing protein n=1 Tax=Rotaria sordida TaxID=392033 RepID=A0A815D876_9BILA|nr:unnamed protein product [Rotaria sordida]
MSTTNNILNLVEKDVDKAIESVQEYYNTIETNIDNVIEQIQIILSNSIDDKLIQNSIQNLIKPLAKQYSDKHKELHGSISKIGKTIDKCFQSDFGNVPIIELFDTKEKLKLIYMIICEDLYRQGRMSIAEKLIEETKLNDNELFNIEKNFLEEINMILENLREKNLLPAINWCLKHKNELNKTGSLLEFHLHKMRFIQLLQMENFDEAKNYLTNLRQYLIYNGQCEQDVNHLMGAFVFARRDLSQSPYKYLLEPHLWLQLSELFMQQAFQQIGLAQDSPLYVVMKIGFQSLPALMSEGASLMHKYNAHACTDVTGFGLLGHAQNLAKHQKHDVSFVIHNLPIIAKMATISKACGNAFGLLQGTSAETSGGLLVVLPREQAAAYCKDIQAQEGYQAWIIGVVEKGGRTAKIIDKPRIIEVPAKDTEGELW